MKTNYSDSHAIVIGINKYQETSPLLYAINDSRAIADILSKKYDFHPDNIHLLIDEEATRESILHEYFSFINNDIDSRLLVYFAGHGFTTHSRRGEVGFLVPYDGSTDDLSTLIRWDELTRNADLIPSKHILFLMDACYGGLAITRSLKPGTTRFLKDMMLRLSRQVITAGKADEVVADEGGPIPEHSIFTGHLIEALEGKASDQEGILTANGLMSYVYSAVGRDPYSYQTPHFGYLDGDGDMIFSAPILSDLKESEKEDIDLLFSVPVPANKEETVEMKFEEKIKQYMSDPKYRIQLHDIATEKTRDALSMLDDQNFPYDQNWSIELFIDRIDQFEDRTNELNSLSALLGYWGTKEHIDILTLPARRLTGRITRLPGLTSWLALRWYPILLLTYYVGIASLASSNFNNLINYFLISGTDFQSKQEGLPLILSLVKGFSEVNDKFKYISGNEKHFAPRSEYLYKKIQPKLDDLLFLGTEYDTIFDKFEVLFYLEHAHQYAKFSNSYWGPIGRFGWKEKRGYDKPYSRLLSDADKCKENWKPIKAGFFDGSYEEFQKTSNEMSERIRKLPWF